MEFLVFGEDYNRHPSSTQHLINEIKKEYPVQWINSIGMRKPTFNKTDIKRLIEKVGLNKDNLYPKSEANDVNDFNLKIVKPLVYPLAENPFIKFVNKTIMKRQIKNKKDEQRVVWVTLPSAIDYLDITDADFVIYYCCDDFSGLAGVDHDIIPKKESQLIKRADLIFTTSDELYTKFKTEKTYMLPHGVHETFFSVKNKKMNKKNKKIGFYGGIDTRLDYELIKDIINSDPSLTLEMIGHIDPKIDSKIFEHPRIKHIPALKHELLVKKINNWDVLLLPFLHNEYSKHCNPLKLREYLATGKPVISTDIPAVREYQSFIEIKEGLQNWINGLNKIYQYTESDLKEREYKIKEILFKETWKERAKQAISDIKNESKNR